MATILCTSCQRPVEPTHWGPKAVGDQVTPLVCRMSNTGAHTVPDEICAFDTDGDNNCAMVLCRHCRPENFPSVKQIDDEDDEIYWYLLECGHYGSSSSPRRPNATRLCCEVCPVDKHPPMTRRIVKRIPSYSA